MSPRKKKGPQEPQEPQEGHEWEGEPEGWEADPFQGVLDSVAGVEDARVDVYRRGPQGPEYVGRLQPDEFGLDIVRERWGGGKFDFRIVARDEETGRPRYRMGKTVLLAGPLKDLSSRMEPEGYGAREDRREAEEDARRVRLRELPLADALDEFRRDLRDFLGAVRNPPPQAYHGEPVTMAVELAKNMQSMMRPYLDAVTARAEREERDPGDVVELIRLGMELANGGRARGEDSYGSMVRELAVPFLRALSPGGGPPPFSHEQPPEAPPPMPPSNPLDLLRPWVPTLLSWAQQGRDPRLRADVIMEEIPERWVSMLGQLVSSPQGLTSFLSQYPETQPWRVWFEELWAELRVGFGLDDDNPQEEEEEEGGPAMLGGPTSP